MLSLLNSDQKQKIKKTRNKLQLGLQTQYFLMIGFLGALTNYPAFSLDALGLWQNGGHIVAAAYVIITLALCLFAATGDIWPTRLI
jgi:CrcB protein